MKTHKSEYLSVEKYSIHLSRPEYVFLAVEHESFASSQIPHLYQLIVNVNSF